MDGRRFDEWTKSLAIGASRRQLLGGLAGGLAAVLGLHRADARVVCPNLMCADAPGVCGDDCGCCLFANGNNRCLPPRQCERQGGTVVSSSPTTTTTAAPTSTTSTTTTTTSTTTTAPTSTTSTSTTTSTTTTTTTTPPSGTCPSGSDCCAAENPSCTSCGSDESCLCFVSATNADLSQCIQLDETGTVCSSEDCTSDADCAGSDVCITAGACGEGTLCCTPCGKEPPPPPTTCSSGADCCSAEDESCTSCGGSESCLCFVSATDELTSQCIQLDEAGAVCSITDCANDDDCPGSDVCITAAACGDGTICCTPCGEEPPSPNICLSGSDCCSTESASCKACGEDQSCLCMVSTGNPAVSLCMQLDESGLICSSENCTNDDDCAGSDVCVTTAACGEGTFCCTPCGEEPPPPPPPTCPSGADCCAAENGSCTSCGADESCLCFVSAMNATVSQCIQLDESGAVCSTENCTSDTDCAGSDVCVTAAACGGGTICCTPCGQEPPPPPPLTCATGDNCCPSTEGSSCKACGDGNCLCFVAKEDSSISLCIGVVDNSLTCSNTPCDTDDDCAATGEGCVDGTECGIGGLCCALCQPRG